MSVTAISGDNIDRAGARDFNDLLLSIPGVSYSGTQLGLSNYSIRGISTAASNPTVGIYLDDVALLTIATSFSGAVAPMLVDLDRVEVLKGPQGTLYGGSAMGGAIKYVSRKPELDKFMVSAGGDLASIDHGGVSYHGESVLNMPLVENHLALRFGVAYRVDSGYIDNIADAQTQDWSRSATLPPAPFAPVAYGSQSSFVRDDYNQRSTTTVRASLLFAPGDQLTILPGATIQHSNQPNPDEFFTNLPEFATTNRLNQPTYDDLDVYSLNITQRFAEGLTLTSLTGYVDRSIELDRDFSLYIGALVPPLLSENSYNSSDTESRTFTQEIRLSSPDTNFLKWIVGVYLSGQRDTFAQIVDTVGAGEFFDDGTDISYSEKLTTETRQGAIFGDVTYALSSRWEANVGLRWFDIKQTINGEFDGVLNGGRTEIHDKRSSDVGMTPKISFTYRPLDNHSLYASASKGFRPGGVNNFNTDSPLCDSDLERLGLKQSPDSYQSDSLWTYEFGSKNVFDHARAVINAAIFYTDWKKIQQEVTLPTCAFQYVGNVGAADVKGAELSAESPLGSRTKLGGWVSYTQTRITESAPGVDAQVGQQLLDTPKWTGNVYAEVEVLKAGRWAGNLRAEYQYHGSNLRQFSAVAPITYSNGVSGEIPDATQVQAAYHVANAAFIFGDKRIQIRLFVDNILDASPFLDFRRPPGFSAATTLRPRTVGIGFQTTR